MFCLLFSFAFGLAGVFCLLLVITMNFNYILEIGCKINDISSYYGYLYQKYYIGLTFFNVVTTMSLNTYHSRTVAWLSEEGRTKNICDWRGKS